MDIDVFRGLMTAALLALFVALFIWTFSGRRSKDFDSAARLPLDEGASPVRDQKEHTR